MEEQQRTVEQIVDFPQFLEETFKVRLVPQERVQWIGEQMVEVPIPRITEEIGEESVAVPVPPVVADSGEVLQKGSVLGWDT